MDWSEHLYQYCERGHSALYWAEPLNAISNAAFLVAGIGAIYLLRERWAERPRGLVITLVALVFAIAIGSYLFHTFANRLTETADVAPITAFVFLYLIFALRFFLGLRWIAVATVMIAFACAGIVAESATCSVPSPNAQSGIGSKACLWGSVAYLPALAALWGIGWILGHRTHQAASLILTAASVFTVSLLLRTIDVPLCAMTVIGNWPLGTHFLWHMLNAVTLFLLLKAAIGPRAKPS